MSVEILTNAARSFEKSHTKRLAMNERCTVDAQRSPKVIGYDAVQ